MAIALLIGRDETERNYWKWFIAAWKRELYKFNPNLDIRVWPDVGNHNEIDFILAWRHPHGALKQFPNAKGIAALGAGVDSIMSDADLPKNIPITRIVDPYMANDIMQYVLATTLHYIKRLDQWEEDQKKNIWDRKPPFNFSNHTVGIMGLGFLGNKAANLLKHIGLNVIGWSNSTKQLHNIKTYTGIDEFNIFLSQTNVLVCLLPLTPHTENILNQNTFAKLPKNSYIINLGRGQHIVDEDLLAALDSGQLSGAHLDVFRQEPLPADHVFWRHPKIHVTPHIASVTNVETAAPQVYDNYTRAMNQQELLNCIDLTKGY